MIVRYKESIGGRKGGRKCLADMDGNVSGRYSTSVHTQLDMP